MQNDWQARLRPLLTVMSKFSYSRMRNVLLVCPCAYQWSCYSSRQKSSHKESCDYTLREAILFPVKRIDVWALKPISTCVGQYLGVKLALREYKLSLHITNPYTIKYWRESADAEDVRSILHPVFVPFSIPATTSDVVRAWLLSADSSCTGLDNHRSRKTAQRQKTASTASCVS